MSVAYEVPSFYLGNLQANQDLSVESVGQYVALTAVVASGAGLAGAAADLPAPGGPIVGVCQNNPQLGEPATIMVSGVSKARVSGAVSAPGILLMVDAAGKFLPATAGNFAVAMAMQSAVAGDVAAILIKQYGKV